MGKSNGSNGSGRKSPALGDANVAARLSMQYRVPTIDLTQYEVAPEVIALIPRDLCERHCVLPVSRAGSSLIVAMVDPSEVRTIDVLKEHTGMNVEPVIAPESAIKAAIERYYGATP